MIEDVLRGYADVADAWIARSEEIPCPLLYRHVIDLLPTAPSFVADIGAGTGRDAGWLAEMGHVVTAVEPVAKFRQAGMALHPSGNIEWVDDRLPDLSALKPASGYDCILVNGVWHHLDETQCRAAINRLAQIIKPAGVLVLSLRHGPGAPDRPVHPVDADMTIADALAAGFKLERRCEAQSLQAENRAAGVHWTWLALRRT